MSYSIAQISPRDKRGLAAADALLEREGIRRDAHLDYTCGVYDDDFTLCATGSCFANTLRCLAVSGDHQGEGLMNLVLSHLSEVQAARGNTHLFLYTKPASAKFFGDLGFYEIARVEGKLVFMENRRTGFADWLAAQKRADAPRERTAAVVMNANPFTLGHRFLLERACAEADAVHLFVLSENYGPIPAADRLRLVAEGTADMEKILLHESGPYIISAATFPGYFLKDSDDVSSAHARLDLQVFGRIAREVGIGVRFVGEEPFSHVTGLYNQVMREELPRLGLDCRIIPRLETDGAAVSASAVRQAVHDGDFGRLRSWVPETTWRYLTGPAGEKAVAAIQRADNVIHH
ncbi:MAG: [Clostridia bacterium]|nr:[citrate (pro-3S)-lyase] ligase [Clostridia bacterium]